MTRPEHDEALTDLLVERALDGLASEQQIDLERALSEASGYDVGSYDRAAAAIHESLVSRAIEPMPAALCERLYSDASAIRERPARASRSESPVPPRPRLSLPAAAGWLTAAASLLLWLAGRATPLDTDEEIARFAALPDAVTVAWNPTQNRLASGAGGRVLWSNTEQRGFMEFDRLQVNDSGAHQYQLWIFDGARPHPVDGGVFDISAEGKVLVPIDAKLLVHSPTLFAVTLEPPGGVVVSDKERILFTAEVL